MCHTTIVTAISYSNHWTVHCTLLHNVLLQNMKSLSYSIIQKHSWKNFCQNNIHKCQKHFETCRKTFTVHKNCEYFGLQMFCTIQYMTGRDPSPTQNYRYFKIPQLQFVEVLSLENKHSCFHTTAPTVEWIAS